MLIGYARVSTQDQTLDLQTDALKHAGCEKIFTDKTTGTKFERPGLQDAMNHLRSGDTLVVWRLDRLGRTLKHLIATITDLSENGIGFKSLQENMDTTTSGGKLIFHIFGALAEFEREVIKERTNAGLQAARARGRLGGRPKIQDIDPKRIALAKSLYADKDRPVQEICDTLHIGRSTLYRYVGGDKMTLDIAGPDLSLETQTFVGRSVALLGITGSGKTNTAAVLIEELLTQSLPMSIVDIEGEYWGLKQSYDLLIAGRSEHAELEIGPENAAQLAKISVQRGISVILDLSDYTQDEQYDFLVAYFQSLWDVAGKERKPYQIILEEAHEWVPQGTRTLLKQLFTRIALRGRKRGLGIILMSQRSAKVEKDVLTQVPLLFLHKVVHPIDLKVYKELIPLPGTQVEAMVGALQPGQAIVVFNQNVTAAQIRLRHTFHAGATPTLGTIVEPELLRIDEKMLRELQALLTSERRTATGPDQARRIKELEKVVAAKDAEIGELQKQITLLSKLQVSVTSPDKLEIGEASVKRMRMNGSPLAIPTQESSTAPKFRIPPKTTEAPPLNERKFTSLANRIATLPKRQRLLLKLLTEKDRLMNVQEIAAWLNMEESTVSKNPPSDLLRLRLVERDRHGDGFHYRSVLPNYLQAEFPGIDVETLVQRLF